MKHIEVYLFGIIILLGSCTLKKEEEKKKKEIASKEVKNDYYLNNIVARETFFNLQEKDTTIINLKGDFYRIDIGNLLNDNNRYSLLTYFTSDTTGMVIISKDTDNGWNRLFSQELEIYHHLNDFEYLRFEDFTGDGLSEILIPYNLAPSHENFNYYCLKLGKNRMQPILGFEELTHPEFDKKTKTIHTLHGGGIGNYLASEFKLENDQLKEIKKIRSSSAPSETSEVGYVQVIETFKIQNGNSNLVKVDSIVGLNNYLPPFWETFFNQ